MLDRDDLMRFRRELNALLVKAGDDDPEAFAQAVELVEAARAGLSEAAARLRTPRGEAGAGFVPGYSWADLAAPLGIARQSAAERFGKPTTATLHAGCPHCGTRAIMPKIDCPNSPRKAS